MNTRTTYSTLLAAGITLAAGFHAQALEIIRPVGVVELFTSQGCSSCPPADRVISELADGKETLALAWHVDYWDYIGWKDTFAQPQFTQRQRDYATSLGESGIYTPQAVINGRTHVVGSRGKEVRNALEEYAGSANGLPVEIGANVENGVLKISVPASAEAAGATLWMVYFDNRKEVKIERGELAGQTLPYRNIVAAMEMIGMVGDKSLEADFPVSGIVDRKHDSCALILQGKTSRGTPGPIIGAAVVRDL